MVISDGMDRGEKKKKMKTPQSVFYLAFPHRGLKSTKLVARKLKKWFSIDSRFAHHRPFKLDVRREKIARDCMKGKIAQKFNNNKILVTKFLR